VDPTPDPVGVYSLAREGRIYRGLNRVGGPAPKLVAAKEDGSALLMDRLDGESDLRLLDREARREITVAFLDRLAEVHSAGLQRLGLEELLPATGSSLADCQLSEIDRWESLMRGAAVPSDPLVEIGLSWLRHNIASSRTAPTLVHGDAGPGNFLFSGGRITGLIDWELAHAGDAMEDLAWVTLRGTLDRVPELPDALTRHCRVHGLDPDEERLLFHQVMVLWKVTVIRQLAVGDYSRNLGRNVYYRLVHRRMYVDVLSRALGVPEPEVDAPSFGDSPRSWLFDACVHHVKDTALPRLDGPRADEVAGLIRVLRYLRIWEAGGASAPRYDPDLAAAVRSGRVDLSSSFEAVAAEALWEHRACRALLGEDADLLLPGFS
jgi:aminoglycoside phosphotransferase (APT) family kinase protein